MELNLLGKYHLETLASSILESLFIAGEYAIDHQAGVVNIGKSGEILIGDTEDSTLRRNAKTKIDEEVQEIILTNLLKVLDPHDFILDAEEDTVSCKRFSNDSAQATIIIDPIDGTLEYIEGSSDFSICFSILIAGGFPLIYVYYPLRRELYAKVGDDIFFQNTRAHIKTRLVAPTTIKDVVYANNRVPQEVLKKYVTSESKIIQSQEIYGWDDALAGCIRGEFSDCIFHTPQMRDVLIGFILMNIPGGRCVDFSGYPVIFPKRGRVPELHFYFE